MSATNRPLILHCSHHKAGSTLIRKIFHDVARHFKLTFVCGTSDDYRRKQRERTVDMWLHPTSNVDLNEIARPIIGSHSIRDPRSIIISGYDFHRNVRTENGSSKVATRETFRGWGTIKAWSMK